MDSFTRIDAAHRRWDVLQHSFYRRWSAGELSRDELAFYAGEYRHAVVALADGLAAAGLDEHAAEEREHVALWDRFAHELGADLSRPPLPETRECVAAWTAGRDTLEGAAAAFAIESAQPAISQTKLSGLLEHYGFERGPATEYFEVHSERDHEHAAQSRELIEATAGPSDGDRLVGVAEGALRGNWTLLDGVERA